MFLSPVDTVLVDRDVFPKSVEGKKHQIISSRGVWLDVCDRNDRCE